MVVDEELSVTARFKELMENTSAHGLGSIDRAGKWGVRKLLWSIIFSFALGMFLLQLYWIGREFINKDVDISVDLRYSRRLNFPAVTICNLNPIKLSALSRNAALTSLLSSSGESFTATPNKKSTSTMPGTDDFPLSDYGTVSENPPVDGEWISDKNSVKDVDLSSTVDANVDGVPSSEPSARTGNTSPSGPVTDSVRSSLGNDFPSFVKSLTTSSFSISTTSPSSKNNISINTTTSTASISNSNSSSTTTFTTISSNSNSTRSTSSINSNSTNSTSSNNSNRASTTNSYSSGSSISNNSSLSSSISTSNIQTPIDNITPTMNTISSGTTSPQIGPVTKSEDSAPAMTGVPSPPPVKPGKKKRAVEEDKKDPGYGDWSDVNYREKSEKLNLFLQVTDAVASVPYDEREALGHDIWDMLLSCSWKGLMCSPYNFTHFFNYKHGNCYTFNSGINGSAEISSKSGPLYGLSLELFLEQSEYISDVQQAAGMRVSIHDQGTMPFPENNGISIQPGTETSVGVRSVLITREPDPYGDCIDPSADDLTNNIFTRFFNANYTLESCEKNCLHHLILERCDCADTQFRYDTEYPPCLSTNATQVACQEEVEVAYINEEFLCSCKNPCNEKVFEMTISSARWPNDQYKPTVASQLSTISDTLRLQMAQDDDFVENNVLKLHVYFEHLNHESITQSPAYTELDCLSDIGGQIGLWIGFSVITWFEIGEFIIDVIIILCKKMYKIGQKRQTSPVISDDFYPRKRNLAFEMGRETTASDILVS